MSDSSPASVRVPAGTFVLMVVLFGVLAGIGEIALLGYDKFVEGKLVFTSRDVFWMAPLANMLYGLVLGGIVFVVAGAKLQPLVFVLAAVMGAAWGYTFPTIGFAALIVGVAAGKLTMDAVGKKGAAFLGTARSLGIVALVGFVVLFGVSTMVGRTSTAVEQGNARQGAPNVVLITLDTVRAQSLSLYKNIYTDFDRDTTPKLNAFAKKGVTFNRAIATAPWTLPTHATLFTGRFHHQLSVDWMDPLDDTWPTLAEAMLQGGYDTAGFVSNLNYTCFEVGVDRGFGHYEDYPVSLGQLILCSSIGRAATNSTAVREMLGYHDNLNRKLGEDIGASFLSWLDGRGDTDRPFFAFLNYYDGHQPYLPPRNPERYGKIVPRTGFRYDTNLIEIENWSELTPEQLQTEEDLYDAAIYYLDEELDRLFAELAQRGELENTVVVVTADHGEQFGEHKLFNHGNSLYVQGLHVPLVIVGPGIPAERRDESVSLRDLPATILDLAGVGNDAGLGGSSLAVYWKDAEAAASFKNYVLSQCTIIEGKKRLGKDNYSLVVNNLHYILNADGSEELYDIHKDPEETNDLTLSPQGREVVKTIRKIVDEQLAIDRYEGPTTDVLSDVEPTDDEEEGK